MPLTTDIEGHGHILLPWLIMWMYMSKLNLPMTYSLRDIRILLHLHFDLDL